MASPIDAFVVDASVAAKWHLRDEVYAEEAILLLERFARGEIALWAPGQIRYAVPSAITAATLGQTPRLSGDVARRSIELFLALGLSTVDDAHLIVAAFDLVQVHGCALYDALYLALSEQLGVPCITADRKLYDRVRQRPDVVWISDYM